jgi:copper chaperone
MQAYRTNVLDLASVRMRTGLLLKRVATMLNFLVADMSCGGCASAITRAVQKIDPNAVVTADLDTKRVAIETSISVEQVQDVLAKAGFPASQQEGR